MATTTNQRGTTMQQNLTHEAFVHQVRDLVISRDTLSEAEVARLASAKLVYGVGSAGVRGTCYYGTWTNGKGTVDTVEIAAAAQENWVQLTGTTIHELAHVLAGNEAGHGKEWKQAAVRLGFTKEPAAAGQVYHLSMLATTVREAAQALAQQLADGTPNFRGASNWLATVLGLGRKPRPCSAGIGTRGGRSRGVGSGSRLRLYECSCARPVKVRVASDNFAAHCDICGEPFERR